MTLLITRRSRLARSGYLIGGAYWMPPAFQS
jgi:hypothetical protein